MLRILKRLWIYVLIFSFFASLKFIFPGISSGFNVDNPDQVIKYLYYLVQIGFWLSLAAFVSQLVKLFFWEGVVNRSVQGNVPQLLIDLSSVLIYIIAVTIIIGFVFKQPLTGFWATSGVVALVLGLALRNIIFDLFTGLAVNIEKSYRIGDWIKIHQRNPDQNITGEVIDINWRTTRIRTEENTLVVIPNSILSTFIVTNYWNTGYRTRFQAEFCIDFSVPVERVRRIAQTAAKEAVTSNGFLSDPEPEVLVKEINEMGIVYKIRYWITVWHDISPSISNNILLTAVLNHFRRAGITPAYPKEDVFFDQMPNRQLNASLLDDRKELLHQIELFESLNDAELEDLAEAMHQIFYKAGETIIYTDMAGSSMFILIEGLCDVYVNNTEINQNVKVAQLKPGQFFGEMSLLTGEPRSATVSAATDTLVYEIKKEHLANLFEKRPEIIIMIGEILVDRRLHNQNFVEAISRSDLEGHAEKTKQQLIDKIKLFFKNPSS